MINDYYQLIIAQSLLSGMDLVGALDRIEQTPDGYPQEGQYAFEDSAGNIVRWHVAGYEILYERKIDTMHLLMATLKSGS
ncbi:MAG: hypothetical protein AAF702_39675 [Chloroflexota bacterium]